MFDNRDFNNDLVSHIKFDSSFNIRIQGQSKIIFGYNGVGKTSVYNYLKSKYIDIYSFVDYETTKDDFIELKKNIIIGAQINKINILKSQTETLNNELDVVGKLKKYNIKNKTAANINQYVNNTYNNKRTNKLDISDDKLNTLATYFKNDNKVEFINNFNQIKQLSNINKEIINLKKNYIKHILDLLEENMDENDNICPICGTKFDNFKDIIQSKKKEYNILSKSVFSDIIPSNMSEADTKKLINEIVEVVGTLDEKDMHDYILCDGYIAIRDNINTKVNDLEETEKIITTLEIEKEEYYNNIIKDKKYIEEIFKQEFDASKVLFDNKNKQIDITLKRPISTYSTGEKNLMVFIAKILEFKSNDKSIIIIDDPLSSYDLINQYKIIYELLLLINSTNNLKNFLVFTHNIDTINIANSQMSSKINYEYIEKYNDYLYLFPINIAGGDSILTLKSLINEDAFGYIDLLIERESHPLGNNFDGHKVFHYDTTFIYNDKIRNNDYLVDLIDNYASNTIHNVNFTSNTYNKVIYLVALRVWIEKQLYNEILKLPNSTTLLNILSGKTMTQKIEYCFPRNGNFVIKTFTKFDRRLIMSKKAMLNQNEHYLSQIIPFNYAMNISLYDLEKEIYSIKEIFS